MRILGIPHESKTAAVGIIPPHGLLFWPVCVHDDLVVYPVLSYCVFFGFFQSSALGILRFEV